MGNQIWIQTASTVQCTPARIISFTERERELASSIKVKHCLCLFSFHDIQHLCFGISRWKLKYITPSASFRSPSPVDLAKRFSFTFPKCMPHRMCVMCPHYSWFEVLFSSASCQMCRIYSHNSVQCVLMQSAWTCEKHAKANCAANNLNQQNKHESHMHIHTPHIEMSVLAVHFSLFCYFD